ncbi:MULTISPECIES: BatD family protein [unclassified Chelatococcus]|uniref:BatD family protein n=1 Tax=unclassified Chelatococcus TaxID=2638111 RepID=UPI001BCF5AF1|nr:MULTISPECIES: BatD family protein [unclassified Chelatococcus]CAH1668873.1 BatD [Hyphomicrobiales bacterium]MBS7739406.1 BatD family protein [Chelatococcus sp. HY11]MBX3543775.1 BatD family protein [Chelatococcus sp.]MCO5076059.1 BatD family protein [Chelatococcus sp.]CAH1679662.1 BatD [Hyphomicrobiales bacterium]
MLLILGLFLMPLTGVAQDVASSPPVVVRTSLSPQDSAVIGQRIALNVDVLFREEMPRPPRVTIPDIQGAQVFRFESQGTTLTDRIGGEPYAGQRFTFAIYARRGGVLNIPPAKVALLDRNGDVTGSAGGQPVSVTSVVPAGVDPSAPVVATGELTLAETWTPDPRGSFKAGDAIQRIITRAASDVPGLAMRDLDLTPPDGVRAYKSDPEIDDRMNRGVVTGHRRDTITYVFARAGTVTLPAVTQPWWDLRGASLKTATGAGLTLSIAAAPAQTAAADEGAHILGLGRRSWSDFAALGLGAIAAVALLLAGLRRAHLWLGARRRRFVASEGKAFQDLIKTCGGEDPARIYRALSIWRRRLPPSAEPQLASATLGLERALFAKSEAPGWTVDDGRALAEHLTRIRGDMTGVTSQDIRTDLPALNPRQMVVVPGSRFQPSG